MNYKNFLFCITLFFVVNSYAFCQTGKIEGTIIDKSTNEVLAGASVTIEETGAKVFTDLDGRFSINDLKPGLYNLKINYISYSSVTISKVEIGATHVTNINALIQKEEVHLPAEIEIIAAKNKIEDPFESNVL